MIVSGPNYLEARRRPFIGQPPPDSIEPYRPSSWQRLSCWLLEWAERMFLHAHGWDRKSEHYGEYVPPESYRFRRHRSYVRSHAVNAQKQLVYSSTHGGTRRDPDYP